MNKVKITTTPPYIALLESSSLRISHAKKVPMTVPIGKKIATSGAGINRGAIVIRLNEIATRMLLIIMKFIDCDDKVNDSAKNNPIKVINKPLTAIAGTILTSLYFLNKVNEKPPVVTEANAKKLPFKLRPLVSPDITI